MNVERNLIISILKLAREEPVSTELIKKDAKIPSQVAKKLLEKMQNDGLVYLQKNAVEANSLQRLKLAMSAVQSGADIETISSFLQWKEFENIAAIAFEQNGYIVKRNLHFKHDDRKWEMDIVGCKKPITVCVDCKHWHHGMYPGSMKRIVEEQVRRTEALTESLPDLAGKIECGSWSSVKLVPVVLSLVVGRFKFHDNVPIVPVLQLQDFLNKLPAYTDSLKFFTKRLANKLNNFS